MSAVSEAFANATHAYAGYCGGCGSMVAIVIDLPGYGKDTARSVAEFIRSGYRVERVTIEEGRNILAFCRCKPRGADQMDAFAESAP